MQHKQPELVHTHGDNTALCTGSGTTDLHKQGYTITSIMHTSNYTIIHTNSHIIIKFK